MAGSKKGVAARITTKYPCIPYVHCFSHKLNLSVVKATQVAKVRDMFDHCRCIVQFFENSPKRTEFLQEILDESTLLDSEKKKLINICRTRFVLKNTLPVYLIGLSTGFDYLFLI